MRRRPRTAKPRPRRLGNTMATSVASSPVVDRQQVEVSQPPPNNRARQLAVRFVGVVLERRRWKPWLPRAKRFVADGNHRACSAGLPMNALDGAEDARALVFTTSSGQERLGTRLIACARPGHCRAGHGLACGTWPGSVTAAADPVPCTRGTRSDPDSVARLLASHVVCDRGSASLVRCRPRRAAAHRQHTLRNTRLQDEPRCARNPRPCPSSRRSAPTLQGTGPADICALPAAWSGRVSPPGPPSHPRR